MGDKARKDFILANLSKLTTSTVIGPEFVVLLLEYGLIDDGEKHILLNSNTPMVTRTVMLYTDTVKKWSSLQFEDFKRVLQETKNFSALEVFTKYGTNLTTPTVEMTGLLPQSNDPPSNTNQQSQLEQINQHSQQLQKTKIETENVNTVVNNESRLGKDNVEKRSSGKELEWKLDSSKIASSNNAANKTKGTTTTTTKILSANHNEGGQVKCLSSSSSSLLVECQQQMNMTELLKKIDSEDLKLFIEDIEVAWKLVKTFSKEELYSFIVNEGTRVCDTLGSLFDVSVCLGKEFVPQGVQLAEFRGKFGQDKGKTVFEFGFSAREFALDVLWGDLLREMDEGNGEGPVTVALREATGRKEGEALSGWRLVEEMEDQVGRRSRKNCSTEENSSVVSSSNNWKGSTGIGVMEWVTEGVHLRNDKLELMPLKALPFFVRYTQRVTPSQLRKILQGKEEELRTQANVVAVLRSLVILSSVRHQDDQQRCFSEVAAFLEENIQFIPPHLTLVTRELISSGGGGKQIFPKNSSRNHVRDISVGAAFLRLIPELAVTKEAAVDKETWGFIVGDIIKFTFCCDLPSVLQELQNILATEEELLKKVLTSFEVIVEVMDRFRVGFWKPVDDSHRRCALRHFLSFYFSVFGSNSLEWTKKGDWHFVQIFPVEISNFLQEEEMNKIFPLRKLLSEFKEILRKSLRDNKLEFWVLTCFGYTSEGDWEALLNLIGEGEEGLLGRMFSLYKVFYAHTAAPLIRVLIRKFGLNWTRNWLTTHHVWVKIPSTVKCESSGVQSLGSLLHSAIELGELSEVKKRAWPGLVKWRNSEGKTALKVAKETKENENKHRIIVLLEDLLTSSFT